MKLLYAPTSPYVRKVLVLAYEAGLAETIETEFTSALPTERNPITIAHNPLGKVPTLITDEGQALFDSRVICEYLDSRSAGPPVFPPEGPARWAALARQSLADGLLDAALLLRYERVLRPEERRWPDWETGQRAKITGCLDRIEAEADDLSGSLTIGTIAVACALGYLDFRFPDLAWRDGRPGAAAWYATFCRRPSMERTVPPAA